MDILHLVDRLEELFNESRSIPFTHSVVVDEDRMLDIIDQMRVSIPDEIKKAQQLLAQRDRILAQAQEETNRTLANNWLIEIRSSRQPRHGQTRSSIRRVWKVKIPSTMQTNTFWNP
jgi:hypothetical protein